MRHHHHTHCHEGNASHGGPLFGHRRKRFGRRGQPPADGAIETPVENLSPPDASAAAATAETPVRLFTCVGKACAHGAQGKALLAALTEAIAARPTAGVRMDVRACGCLDMCEQGPVVVAYKGGAARAAQPPKSALAGLLTRPVDRFGQVSAADAGRIVDTVLRKIRRA